MPNVMKSRVLLVDDHEIVLEGLKTRLEAACSVDVVGGAGNFGDALRLYDDLRPGIVILDMDLPGGNGNSLAEKLLMLNPELKVIIYSAHQSSEFVLRAVDIGVCGYVSKSANADEIVRAVQSVLGGFVYFSAPAMTMIYKEYRGYSSDDVQLSEKERLVLRGIYDGKPQKEIAKDMGISVKTVSVHLYHLKKKLRVPSNSALVRQATRDGLFETPGAVGERPAV